MTQPDRYSLTLTGLLLRELELAAADLGTDKAEACRILLHEALGRHRARMRSVSMPRAAGEQLPTCSLPAPPRLSTSPQHVPNSSRHAEPAVIRTSGDKTEGQPLRGGVAPAWTEEAPAWDGEIADALHEKLARRRPSSGPIKDEGAWRARVEADLRAGPPGKVRELAREWHHRQERDHAKAEAARAELEKRAQIDQAEREELARRAEQLRQGRASTRTETGLGSTLRGGSAPAAEGGRSRATDGGSIPAR